MRTKSGMIRAIKVSILLLLGGLSMGGSCAADIRYNMVQGGLSYVRAATADVAGAMFPVADWLSALLTGPAE